MSVGLALGMDEKYEKSFRYWESVKGVKIRHSSDCVDLALPKSDWWVLLIIGWSQAPIDDPFISNKTKTTEGNDIYI